MNPPPLEMGRAVELAKLHEWFQTILTAPTSSYNRHPPCRLLHHPPGNGQPLLIGQLKHLTGEADGEDPCHTGLDVPLC